MKYLLNLFSSSWTKSNLVQDIFPLSFKKYNSISHLDISFLTGVKTTAETWYLVYWYWYKCISITFLPHIFYIFSSQSIVQRSGRALWQLPCRTETQSPLAGCPMQQTSTQGPVFIATGMLSITPPIQPYTRELRSSSTELPRTQTMWHLKILLRLSHEVLGTFWYTDFTAQIRQRELTETGLTSSLKYTAITGNPKATHKHG